MARQPSGQLLGPRQVAVDDGNIGRSGIDEIAKRFLPHLSSPDDEDLLVVEPLEELAGVVGDGDAGNADPLLLDGGLGGDPLGDAERGLEGGIGQRADGIQAPPCCPGWRRR